MWQTVPSSDFSIIAVSSEETGLFFGVDVCTGSDLPAATESARALQGPAVGAVVFPLV